MASKFPRVIAEAEYGSRYRLVQKAKDVFVREYATQDAMGQLTWAACSTSGVDQINGAFFNALADEVSNGARN